MNEIIEWFDVVLSWLLVKIWFSFLPVIVIQWWKERQSSNEEVIIIIGTIQFVDKRICRQLIHNETEWKLVRFGNPEWEELDINSVSLEIWFISQFILTCLIQIDTSLSLTLFLSFSLTLFCSWHNRNSRVINQEIDIMTCLLPVLIR